MTGKFKVGDRVREDLEGGAATVLRVGPIPGGFHYEIQDDPGGYPDPYPVFESELVLLTEEAAA